MTEKWIKDAKRDGCSRCGSHEHILCGTIEPLDVRLGPWLLGLPPTKAKAFEDALNKKLAKESKR